MVLANAESRSGAPSASGSADTPPHDVFLSYKREDRDTAKALAEILAKRGYNVWWDVELLPGDRFADAIAAVINRARVTIVLWSERAVTSDYVRSEADLARQADKLIPARLDDCALPIPFNGLQTLDLRGWRGDADEASLQPLFAALTARIGEPKEADRPASETDANLHMLDAEALRWRSISERDSISEYAYYLETYPDGMFVDLARLRLEELRRPAPGRSIVKLGGIAAALAAIIGLFALVRDEVVPPLYEAFPGLLPPAPQELPETLALSYVEADADAASPYAPGDTFKDCAECPEMVVVPAKPEGFMMGSPEGEEGRDDDEGPQHRVTIAEPFAIGVYEVTFDEWDACVDDGGCNGYQPDDEDWGRGRRPVIKVSWNDAQAYVDWLSDRTDDTYRLPSEAEWEYAARAGTTTPFHFGLTISTDQANYDGNYTYGSGREGVYREQTVPVGSFPANAFGLHDVHGNVLEWVEDCWNDSYAGAPANGTAWTSGDCDPRVLRGGSWYHVPRVLRSADRLGHGTDDRFEFDGFRVARTVR